MVSLSDRRRFGATVAYYRSLCEPDSAGWQESRLALEGIIELCRSRDIPCCVLLFPLLLELDDEYPFREIHAEVAQKAEGSGATIVDLLPRLMGMNAQNLWVHPTDQHPNEVVHEIAAEALAERIAGLSIMADWLAADRSAGASE